MRHHLLIIIVMDGTEALDRIKDHGRILVISNISKFGNICRLIIAALSHSFVPVLVGCSSISTEKLFSVVGKDSDAQFYRVETLDSLSKWLSDCGYAIIGIEITDASVDITKMDTGSAGKVALMPGNEGLGLSNMQKDCCHRFVYIPQYSSSIESLNVAVATTLVLNLM